MQRIGNKMVSIRSILLGSFLTMLILTVMVGGFGILSLQSANETLDKVMNLDKVALEAIDNARSAQVHFKIMVRPVKNFV